MDKMVTFDDDFTKVDLRIRTILEVLDFPARNPSYQLIMNFGPLS
jgi:hypothetical protein